MFFQLRQSCIPEYTKYVFPGAHPGFVHGTGLIEGAFIKTHNAGSKHIETFHRIDNFGQGNLMGRFLKQESTISSLNTYDKATF